MKRNKYYITTTLPYVNSKPHVGFALEIVQADVLARYHTLLGEDIVFNFGTDEHGQKIYQKAKEEGVNPQEYCDKYAKTFEALKIALNLSYTNFIRTTDENHIKATGEFWKRCLKSGDIYKKNYKQKYCVGCELEKTDSELVDGKCPIHPTNEIEIIEEENYFFKFSKYQDLLLKFYETSPNFVIPEGKYKEIKQFVKAGLQDFSISRLASKMPWGIPVPEDKDHVMYVWFDALINYISTLGWPENAKNFEDYWPGVQVAGKDNLRQQTAIWQSMLMSAGLPNSKEIFIHGFITVNGQKISKSIGNVVDPIELVEKYGTDAVRYYLLANINPYEDSDFTFDKFEEAYNSDLANGLGNLVARVAKLSEKAKVGDLINTNSGLSEMGASLEKYRFDDAINFVWAKIKKLDQDLNIKAPWNIENVDDLKKAITPFAQEVLNLSSLLLPFLPETAEKITNIFCQSKITSGNILFPRLK